MIEIVASRFGLNGRQIAGNQHIIYYDPKSLVVVERSVGRMDGRMYGRMASLQSPHGSIDELLVLKMPLIFINHIYIYL